MNNSADFRRVGLIVLTVLAWACDAATPAGTELEIDEFVLNECKTRKTSGLLTGRETNEYSGLECVAWDFQVGDVVIDLINRPADCGFSGDDPEDTLWSPSVRQLSANQIEYDVQWNIGFANACEGCWHDFSVRLSDVELEKRVRIDVATRSCNAKDCPWQRDSLRADEPSGIRCRYVNDAGSFGEDWGKLRCHPFTGGTCDRALVATELPDGSTRCLSSCESDDDCSLSELEICRDGVCQLSDAW